MKRQYDLGLFKIAFFDLDGTLLNSSGKASSATRRAVERLKQHGLHISLATGRASFGSMTTVDFLEINDPCVFFSGSCIMNPKSNEVLFEAFLAPSDTMMIVERCRRHDIYVELYNRSTYFIEKPGAIADMHAEYMGHYPAVVDLHTVAQSETVLKATLVAENGEQEKVLREMQSELALLNFGIAPGATAPDIYFANATARSASRQNAFHSVLKHLGLQASEAIAFGDASSDIPFLEMSGLGIALGNAEDPVKGIADFVTRPVDEEGILYAVETLFGTSE